MNWAAKILKAIRLTDFTKDHRRMSLSVVPNPSAAGEQMW